MITRFQCPICNMELEAEADVGGTQVLCPGCSTVIAVPAKELHAGTVIGGFEIRQLIGKGGMGEVYLARQLSMDRDIALKILPPGLTEGAADRPRFLNEVRMLARLEHANIVPAYEAGEDGGIMYLAMAYIKGETLEARLRDGRPLAQKEALVIIRKVGAALAYAWREHRMLHRDVKPANIMIDAYGEPRLMDMGLAVNVKDKQGMTQTGVLVGTPNYMSPEHLRGGELDFRTDIYSLGATLYHLLTGRMPFLASSVLQTLRKQLSQPLADPRVVNPHATEACVQLMERMMAKKTSQRYASWEELQADIQAVLANGRLAHPPLASGASMLQRRVATQTVPAQGAAGAAPGTPRSSLRPLLLSGGIAAVVGLLILIVAVSVNHAGRRNPQQASVPAAGAAAVNGVPAPRPEPPAPVAQPPRQPVATPVAGTHVAPKVPAPATEPKAPAADAWAKMTEKATNDLLASLKQKTDALAAQGMFAEAAALLLDYRGAFAKETAEGRKALAKPLQERAATAQTATAAQADVETALKDLATAVAADLRKGDTSQARRRLAEAQPEARLKPVAAQVAALAEITRKVGEAQDRIVASFENDIGKEIAVALKDGKAIVLVDAVNGQEVTGRRKLEAGFIGCRFGCADLALPEKNQRLGQGHDAATEIVRGLLDSEAGDSTRAAAHFKSAGTPLGVALLAGTTGAGENENPDTEEAVQADGRLPVPEDSERTRATRQVLEQFKEEYRAARGGKPEVLARTLLQAAQQGDATPAVRFAMLEEAHAAALRGGDLRCALAVATEKGARFAVNPLNEKVRVLATAGRTAKSPEAAEVQALAYLALTDEALAADNPAAATRYARDARDWAQKAKNSALTDRTRAKQQEVTAASVERRQYDAALDSLRTSPADPDANTLVGRRFCFDKGLWEKGLPLLSKSGEAPLREAAKAELAKPAARDAWVAVGNRWLEAAQQETGGAADAMQQRAWRWFEEALPELPEEMAATLARKCNLVSRWRKVAAVPAPVHLGQGLAIEMVWIRPGTFMMGTVADEPDRTDREVRHEVRLSKGFWMSRHELTLEQFYRVMGKSGGGAEARTPILLSWYDGEEFMKKLNAWVGDGRFRFPTEAEWEYACRAGNSFAYSLGNTMEDLNRVAWYKGNSRDKVHAIRQKEPNAWGLFDMLGNADEWCSDWYEYQGWGATPRNDPTGPAKASSKVVRGGRFGEQPGKCRCGARSSNAPSNTVGLRLCLTPER